MGTAVGAASARRSLRGGGLVARREPRRADRHRRRRPARSHRQDPLGAASFHGNVRRRVRPCPARGRGAAGAGPGPGRRGRLPAPQLDRSGRHLLGGGVARRRCHTHRALLRAQGGRLHPAAHRVRALVTADRFGRMDYLAALDGLRAGAPSLELVAVVGDSPAPADAVSFDRLLEGDPLDRPLAVDPTAPALVAYTSGTTADPKGVVHSHRTIGFEVRQLASMQSGNPPLLVGAPVGHAIGMLSGLLVPMVRNDPINLIDVWDPAAVLEAMIEDHLAAGSGATYFLTSLLDHPDCGPEHLKLMSRIGLGGSPVPSAVTERMAALGISAVRSYGSTEHPSTTGSRHEEPEAKRHYTDGRPLLGVELRLVDEGGRDVTPGERGEIWSRGPDCCIGYTDPTLTASNFDPEGWFATGDVGVLDAEGYLTIVDRKKDVIIRGG